MTNLEHRPVHAVGQSLRPALSGKPVRCSEVLEGGRMNRDHPLNLLILGFWTGPYLLAWTWAAWLNEVNACLEGGSDDR